MQCYLSPFGQCKLAKSSWWLPRQWSTDTYKCSGDCRSILVRIEILNRVWTVRERIFHELFVELGMGSKSQIHHVGMRPVLESVYLDDCAVGDFLDFASEKRYVEPNI